MRLTVGRVSVNATDEFILAWMELQNNLLEYVSGEYAEPTAQAIMRQAFRRERTGRTENPDATMFVKLLHVTLFEVDLKFLRKTALAMDLFLVPKVWCKQLLHKHCAHRLFHCLKSITLLDVHSCTICTQ